MGGRETLNETKEERQRRWAREWARRTYKRRREAAVQALAKMKSVPCADCGQTFPPCAMDVRLPNGREFHVTSQSPQSIKRALSKADIVCANCGRERAYEDKWSLYKDGIK